MSKDSNQKKGLTLRSLKQVPYPRVGSYYSKNGHRVTIVGFSRNRELGKWIVTIRTHSPDGTDLGTRPLIRQEFNAQAKQALINGATYHPA